MTRRRSSPAAAAGRNAIAGLASLIAASSACGGSASTPARAPAESVPTADSVSIADTAAAQGGLASLGGGSNRSNADLAMSGSLHLDLVAKDSPVKLDGMLNEWPARTAAKATVKGSAAKTAFAIALQYDDARLYVGGDVADDALVRTRRFAEGEDHASVVLAFPVGSGGALAAYEVALFAGKPGETSGAVRFASGSRRGQDVPGARIVEAPASGGYSFEASIPWTAFPEAHRVRVGLRGLGRYYDADGSGSARTIVATSPGDVTAAAGLPPLPTDPEQAMTEGLLVPKGLLGEAPRFDVVADVAGDGMKERVAVFGSYLTICGPGYRGGREYFFRDLGADVLKLEARQVTGRAKEDLVLRRRFESGGTTRESFEVWSILGGGDEPVATFAHEISIAAGPKHLDNAVHLTGRDLEVSVEPAVGWDPATYREPVASDVQPILFPWGGVKSRVFRFDGKTFAKVKETTQTPAPNAGSAPPAPGDEAPARAIEKEPVTPTVRRGGDLSAQVFDLYKRDHGGQAVTPRFDLQVNVSGDARPERVVLMNKDIVVFGPGFKGGTGYATLTLQQFDGASDVKDMTARDMDGDGTADLVVRGVRRVNAQATGGGGASTPVEIEALFIYAVRESGIARVFAIETAREQGGKRVQGLVQFVPAAGGKSFEIDVRPGMAKGWTAKSYPWQQDAPGAGALEPLLLPWGNVPSLRYAWNGSAFAPK